MSELCDRCGEPDCSWAHAGLDPGNCEYFRHISPIEWLKENCLPKSTDTDRILAALKRIEIDVAAMRLHILGPDA